MLAERWEVDQVDKNVWTFHLKRGVKRQNDGKEFTAEDVVHSINRINTDPQSKQKQNIGPIKEVIAVDQYTVKVVTKQPTASLLEYLFDRVFITGKDLFDKHGIVVLTWGIACSMLALPLGFFGGTAGGILAVLCWATGLGVQDASLRAGIAQVVSMNKRGTAFGTFNGIYGVMWFVGSTIMGLLYGVSMTVLVAFGVLTQLTAAVMFFSLRRPLADAAL